MAENVILAEQTFNEFSYIEAYGLFCQYVSPAPFVPVIGETYKVVWDGETFTCGVQDAGNLIEGALFIGNATAFGLSGNNEPFIIGGTSNSPLNIYAANDTEATSHTVAIYQVEAEEVGIVIKNYSGTPIEYKGVEKVMFNTADGGKRVYSRGEALEDVSIELDFSSGDQTVKAAEGTLVKSAVIKKPETLLPENIAEGINIGGIIGTLAASSGGGSAVISGGTVSGVANGVTITHNLGIAPQIIGCYTTDTSSGCCFLYLYVDSGVANSIGLTNSSLCASRTSSGVVVMAGNLSIYKYFSKITDTTFKVGSSNAKMYAGKVYDWFAIGGLA